MMPVIKGILCNNLVLFMFQAQTSPLSFLTETQRCMETDLYLLCVKLESSGMSWLSKERSLVMSAINILWKIDPLLTTLLAMGICILRIAHFSLVKTAPDTI